MYHYWYNHWIIIKIMPCVIIMHDYMELLVLLVLSISIWNIVGKSMHSIGLYLKKTNQNYNWIVPSYRSEESRHDSKFAWLIGDRSWEYWEIIVTLVSSMGTENPRTRWRFVAGNIIYKWSVFHCHVWLREAIWLKGLPQNKRMPQSYVAWNGVPFFGGQHLFEGIPFANDFDIQGFDPNWLIRICLFSHELDVFGHRVSLMDLQR